MFLNLLYVPRKVSEKNYLGKSNIALFTCEICNIWSEDHFYLERTEFGNEIHKGDREFIRRILFLEVT